MSATRSVAVAALLILLGSAPAGAQEPDTEEEVDPSGVDFFDLGGHWTLTGLSLGTWWVDGEASAMLGVELSYAYVHESYFQAGAYVDLRYDQNAAGAQLGLGVQGGWAVLVADAGLVARFGRRSSFGVRARGCLAFAALSFCAGGGITTAAPFVEAAVLLKYPYRRGGRRGGERRPVERRPTPAAQ